jgi:hypothetical protein
MCLEEKSKVGNPEKYTFHAYVFGFSCIPWICDGASDDADSIICVSQSLKRFVLGKKHK